MMKEADVEEAAPRGPSILVAEDDTVQRLLYTRILMSAGFNVIGTDNGQDAVALARSELPSLVLMDVTMPGLDGCSATRELKRDIGTKHIPIILMTGLIGEADEAACIAAGCDAFLAKPTPVRQLLATILRFAPSSSATA